MPLGDLSYGLIIKPVHEYSIEGDGLLVREGIPPGFRTTNAIIKQTKHQNWSLVYEALYQLNPINEFLTIMCVTKDPLAFLNELLLRHDDDELDHKCCLALKYPMWVYSSSYVYYKNIILDELLWITSQ